MNYKLFQKGVILSYGYFYCTFGKQHHLYQSHQTEFWWYLFICLILIICCAFFSGATQGLLSIDLLSLELKMQNGTDQEKEMAEKLFPVIKEHHLLLSTLLIGNACCTESLPLFLHALVPDWAAVLISTLLVLIVGEIIPSAFTTGPNQFQIAVKMIPYVKVVKTALYVIVFPLSLILDWILGIHGKTRYPMKDLRALLYLHADDSHKQTAQHVLGASALSKEEINLINSTMDLRDELIVKQSININNVFMVSSDEIFNKEFVHKLKVKGFSRIPVHAGQDKQQILGSFNAKSILKFSELDYGKPIRNLIQLNAPLIVSKHTSLLQMFMIFQERRKTLAFISDQQNKKKDSLDITEIDTLILDAKSQEIGQIIGIICLNNIFREMLEQELLDEDVHGTLRNNPFDRSQDRKRTSLKIIKEERTEGLEKGLEKGSASAEKNLKVPFLPKK